MHANTTRCGAGAAAWSLGIWLLISGPSALAGSTSAGGNDPNAGSTASTNPSQVTEAYWYDGNQRRTIWVDTQAGTVTTATPTGTGKSIKRAMTSGPSYKGLPAGPSRNVVTADNPNSTPASAVSTAIGATSKSAATTGSDTTAATTLTQALPGGVIIELKTPLDDASARALLASRGLTPVREIGSGSGQWLLQSDPGLASLTLANSLYESGLYQSAQPNWWQARTLK